MPEADCGIEINNTITTNLQSNNTDTNLTITDDQQQPPIINLKHSSLERPSNSSTDNVSKPSCVVEFTKQTINQLPIAEQAPIVTDRPAAFVEIQLQPSASNPENNETALTAEEKKSVDGVKTIKRQSSKGWF